MRGRSSAARRGSAREARMRKLQPSRYVPAEQARCGDWPASGMTRNMSASSMPWIGSRSNHSRPGRRLRSLRRQGVSFERAGLSEGRIPIASSTTLSKRECAFRQQRGSRSMGVCFVSLVR